MTAVLGAVTTATTHVLAPVTGSSQSAAAPPAPASAAPSAPAPEPAAASAATVDHAVAPSSGAPAESSAAPPSAVAVQAPTRASAPTARVLDAPHGVARQLGVHAAAIVRRPVRVASESASARIAARIANASSSRREAVAPTGVRAPVAGVVDVRTLIGSLARAVAPARLAATLDGATARLESTLTNTLARFGTLTPAASLLQPILAVTPTAPLPAGGFGSLGAASPVGSSAAAGPDASRRTGVPAQLGAAMTETPIEASGASLRRSRLTAGGRGGAITVGGRHAAAPGEALAPRTRSIAATSPATTPGAVFAASRARHASPSSPAPVGGIGAGASANGVAGGFGLSLTLALAALLLALAPYTQRRLRLAAARWRIAPLRLVPDRPG